MQADREKTLRMLKAGRGQIDGLIRMVEENRYCIDISNQLMATQAILRSINREVLHAHLTGCVSQALNSDEQQKKIDEIIGVMDKLSK